MTSARTRGIRALVIAVLLGLLAAVAASRIGDIVNVQATAHPDPGRFDRDPGLAWFSRILLVLSLAWAGIGFLSAGTSLVGRPGAAGTRSNWLSITRPWRSRESILGMLPLDRLLLIVVPVALLLATRLVEASFTMAWSALMLIALWALGTLTAILLVRPRSPWPIIATVGGGIVMQCTYDLICYSIAGPAAFWDWLWHAPQPVRILLLTGTFGIVAWTVAAMCGTANAQVGALRATGVGIGAVGAVTVAVGLEALVLRMLNARAGADVLWSDEILAVHAAEWAPWTLLGVGALGTVVGSLIARRNVSTAQ